MLQENVPTRRNLGLKREVTWCDAFPVSSCIGCMLESEFVRVVWSHMKQPMADFVEMRDGGRCFRIRLIVIVIVSLR